MPHNSRYLQSEWSQDYLLMSNSIKKTSHYLQITWKASKHQWLGAQTHWGKLNIFACFEKVRLWYFYWVSFGLLMSSMNEMFATSIHNNEVSVASLIHSGCPNKFGMAKNSVLKLRNVCKQSELRFQKICIFAPKNCVLSIFSLTAKWKCLSWNKFSPIY